MEKRVGRTWTEIRIYCGRVRGAAIVVSITRGMVYTGYWSYQSTASIHRFYRNHANVGHDG